MPEAYSGLVTFKYASGTPEYLFSGLGEADSASLHCMILVIKRMMLVWAILRSGVTPLLRKNYPILVTQTHITLSPLSEFGASQQKESAPRPLGARFPASHTRCVVNDYFICILF